MNPLGKQMEKVLVVDDNEAGRYIKVRTLQRAGYDVIEAPDGRGGLNLAQLEPVALVVLDVKLPDISGLDVGRMIKERDPSILILHTSATFRTMSHRVAGLEGGADSYLVEPMEPGELLATVRALLRLRTAERELRRSNDALEVKVQARTAELAATNEKLREEIAQRVVAEETLRHAQKMDVLGQLTGSIAHDFNNLLAIIQGNLEFLRRRLPKDMPALIGFADNAFFGARRAVNLTKQLLAFSRRQSLTPRRLQLGDSIEEITEFLRQALGQRVSVTTDVDGGVWPVEVDQAELETAVLNLALNARDAMSGEGTIVITVRNCTVAKGGNAKAPLTPGDYVAIGVTDTGKGMDTDVVKYAFEPFFTTKDVGQGTGLGLSQVHGFATQAGGGAQIESEIGVGTTVTIFLPRFHGTAAVGASLPESEADLAVGSPVHVLVVEDNDHVRDYSAAILQELGYIVLLAHDAQSALKVLGQRKIDVLFSDLGLPGGMDGRELAEKASELNPSLKVLLTTGYARREVDVAPFALIAKPFTFTDIGRKLRELLEAGAGEREMKNPRPRVRGTGRLLLVEDEALIRLDAAEALRERGYDVEEAGTARQALDALHAATDTISGVIIDLGLPDRRGDDLAAELRAASPLLPIIIASGFSSNEVRGRFGQDARMAFIDKPFSADQVHRALEAMRRH